MTTPLCRPLATPQYLQVPSGIYEPNHAHVVQRYALSYAPKSSTQINYERLPPFAALISMQMAFREQQLSDHATREMMENVLLTAIPIAWALCTAIVLVGPFGLVPYASAIGSAGLLLPILLFYRRRRMNLSRVLRAFALPCCALVASFVLLILEVKRSNFVFMFGALWMVTLGTCCAHLFGFYRDYLLTHPRLRPATRSSFTKVKTQPHWWFVIVVVAAMAYLPKISQSLTLLVVTVLSIALLLHSSRSLWDFLKSFGAWFRGPWKQRPANFVTRLGNMRVFGVLYSVRQCLAQYFTYGVASTGAPGVWLPDTHFRERQMKVIMMLGVTYITLAIGLSMYGPWDVMLRIMPAEMFEQLGYSAKRAHEKFPDHAASWIANTWRLGYRSPLVYFYLFAFVLSLVVPHLVLLAALSRPMAALAQLRLDVEGVRPTYDNDAATPRTEWQWYVDRLHASPHVAVDPMGRKLYEREHLFMGVEPMAQFPVLLDRSLLAEHVYIVGQSGSGKTSLGVMPLLVQLIRGPGMPDPLATADGPPAAPTLASQLFQSMATDTDQQLDGDGFLDAEDVLPTAEEALAQTLVESAAQSQRSTPAADLMPPIVIIDLKGDPGLFHLVREEVHARRAALGIDDTTEEGKRDPRCAFRFFTPEVGKASHYFNPFDSLQSPSRSLIQLCQLLLDSLSLNHGEGYGRSYYSRRSRTMLMDALRPQAGRVVPQSFDELFAVLKGSGDTESIELVSVIQALTSYPMLATQAPPEYPEMAIHMPSVLEHRQVVYFWLPAAIESVSVREIAKLAMYSLLTAAIDRQRSDKSHVQSYLVIDEFQRIAGENFRIILEQARSFGIGAVLANQSLSDLKTPDADLRSTVLTNTRVKQYFTMTDPREVADLMAMSGEELAIGRQWGSTSTPHGDSASSGFKEMVKPRLTINDILRISDHPLDSVLHINRGGGYAQFGGVPIPVRNTWPISRTRYDSLVRTPWPTLDSMPLGAATAATESPVVIDMNRERAAAEAMAARLTEFAEQAFGNRPAQGRQDVSAAQTLSGSHRNGQAT